MISPTEWKSPLAIKIRIVFLHWDMYCEAIIFMGSFFQKRKNKEL